MFLSNGTESFFLANSKCSNIQLKLTRNMMLLETLLTVRNNPFVWVSIWAVYLTAKLRFWFFVNLSPNYQGSLPAMIFKSLFQYSLLTSGLYFTGNPALDISFAFSELISCQINENIMRKKFRQQLQKILPKDDYGRTKI